MPPQCSLNLLADEAVLLTSHQNGVPDEKELLGHRYSIRFENGVFVGFYDPADSSIYPTASSLCKAKLNRLGSKNTNEWRGPRHCLVLRNGAWLPIGSL